MVAAARAAGVDAPVVVGGIIPEADVDELKAAGVAVVLTPGASEAEVVAAIAAALEEQGGD
jgi:methylmalonyl-CoA mutase cobalamin-binding domain/chain